MLKVKNGLRYVEVEKVVKSVCGGLRIDKPVARYGC